VKYSQTNAGFNANMSAPGIDFEAWERNTSGLKAPSNYGLCPVQPGTSKLVPRYKNIENHALASFSASCESVLFQSRFTSQFLVS
jgi:hypothetical protein